MLELRVYHITTPSSLHGSWDSNWGQQASAKCLYLLNHFITLPPLNFSTLSLHSSIWIVSSDLSSSRFLGTHFRFYRYLIVSELCCHFTVLGFPGTFSCLPFSINDINIVIFIFGHILFDYSKVFNNFDIWHLETLMILFWCLLSLLTPTTTNDFTSMGSCLFLDLALKTHPLFFWFLQADNLFFFSVSNCPH